MSSAEIAAGLSSAVLRLSALTFLRWIPGHHFPPIIVASLIIYLVCIYRYSNVFYTTKRSLPEAFPALSDESNGSVVADKDDVATLIGQGDIPEEPIIDREDRSFFKAVILGIPDWNEVDFSYFGIGLNILLALLSLDLVFRGPILYPSTNVRFSRVGYVDDVSAKILVREPDLMQYPIYAHIKDHSSGKWKAADTTFYAGEDTDYTFSLIFESLSPEIEYTYDLSNSLTGTFKTAPPPTSPANEKLVFLTSSCIKANFPYNPFNHALEIPGFKHLSQIIQSFPSPAAFMLFLGDFIYVDVPLRLSSTVDHYRAEYRRVYASPSWKLPGISSVPWFHTIDDHEIANDWAGGNETEPFPSAADPFIHYHVSVNPPMPPFTTDSNTTYFEFTRGPASFFLLDTRRYRTAPESSNQQPQLPIIPIMPPSPSSSSWFSPFTTRNTTFPSTTPNTTPHTILGATQLASLLRFLSTPPPGPHVHWKIITTSVPFTQNWRFGTKDTWGGFLHERQLVLNAMHAAERDLGVRVVILSGDRHEFGAVKFPERRVVAKEAEETATATATAADDGETSDEAKEVEHDFTFDPTPHAGPHEFSVGPLSMFYLPFRTFKQVDGQDVAIKYLPDGNSKVGVVEIQNLKGKGVVQKSLLKYSLWVDGRVEWEYSLTSPGPGWEEGRRGRVGRWW